METLLTFGATVNCLFLYATKHAEIADDNPDFFLSSNAQSTRPC
jgi:hypothetical protein